MATGLKGLNTKEGNDREMQRMGDSRPSFADYQRAYNLSTPVRREVGAYTPEDFGASVYDNEVKSFQDLNELGDVRAENQPWFLKIANGIGKATVLAGTTFVNGTIGLVTGLATAIQEGRFSGLWDNDFSRAMQSINDWSEEVMPNYYSKAEQESPWYENMITANFWGDKFIKNLGFAIGALYTGKVVGAPLVRIVANLAKSRGAAQMVASATGAAVSAINEGRIEALNNTRDWFNLQKEKLTSRMAERLDAKGIGYSTNDNGDLIIDQSSSGGVQEASIYNSTLEKLTEDRLKMGNMDLLMNLPILTFSNIVQFGRFYSKGFDTGRKISNSLIRGKKGAALAATKGALAEGTEEISQKAASVVSGKYYESDVDSYFKSRIDPNAEKEAIGFIQANMEGIAETLGDPNSWEEFTIGALTGVLGIPTFRSARTEEGKWRSPIVLEGNAVQHWKEHMSKVKRAEEIDAYINNRIQSPEYLNYYQGLISHIKRDNEKEDFLRSGDKFNYLNAEHRQLVEDIIMFDNAGRLEELKDMINSAFDTSDENLHSIVKNTTKEVNGKLTGPFAEFAVRNPDGTVEASLDNGGREAITESLRDKADRIQTEINNYRKVKDKLDESTNGVFTDSQLGELAWMQSHIDNWESRLGSMGTVLRDTLSDIRSKIEDKRNLADKEREESLMREGASQKEIEDSVKRVSNYENYIKSIDTILSVPKERLGNMLSNNKQFTESLFANTLVLGSDIISGLDKNNVLTLLDDVIRIGDAQAIYREKLEEYLNNPESLTASNDRAREEVSDNIRAEEIRTLEKQLENAQSISEIRNIAEGSNKDNIDAVIQKWQDGTDDTLKRKAANYKETAQYDSELKKALNELGETDQVSQDAMALWQEQFNAAENLEQLANPNSIYINNEDAFLEDSESDIDMANNRFQSARYAIQRAMSKVNNDIRFKNRFSEKYRKPVDEPVVNKGIDKDETGDSGTSTVPHVNPNATPVETPSAPVGNITSEMVASENSDANRRVETQRTLDQSQQGQRKYYRPAVPELHIEASKEGDFRPFDVVVAEREPGVDFSGIYSYLRDNGAFNYVNAAKIKPGDTLGFMIDPDFNDHTIFLVDTRNNQIVGSIDESDASVARYEGLAEVIKKVRDEYQASRVTQAPQSSTFTTDYRYDQTMDAYDIKGTLDRVENGTAIYVDSEGNPVILIAARSDHQFIGIFRESNSDRWSIKMENKEGEKSAFKDMIASAMAQLPIGAEVYERTSISLDGLRVFAQQLNHGFVIGNETYETDINGGDLANVFGLSKEAQEEMGKVQVSQDELPRVKEILRPYLEKFGVRNIDNVVYLTNGNTLSIKLPVLVKSSNPAASNTTASTSKFFATPQVRVSKMMVGRIPYGTEDRSLADIPGVLDGNAKPIFGIIKNGVLTTNEKIDDRLIIKPVDMSQKEGRLYLLIPNAAGTYSPATVRVKHFNNQEFNLDDATVANTPIGRDINEALDRLADATSQDDVSIAMKELAQGIYMQDVMVTWFDAKAGSGIVISRKVRNSDGTYEMVDINGQKQIREDKYTIYYQNSKDKIIMGGMEVFRDSLEEGIKNGLNSPEQLAAFGQPRDAADIRRDILNTILGFNLPIQVSASRINDSGYNNRVIKSNVLTSNLREAKVIGSWFTTDYFDKQGNLQRAISPSSIKPAPGRRTTTPVGGTEGVIQGTPVSIGGSTYTVDLKTMVYTDSKGAKYAATTSNANIFAMAWAQENFGDSTESSVMTENKVITPQGRVLDRNTGTYVSEAEAKRIKDKIAGRSQATQNRVAESKRVIADIYENQKRVDKTRTNSDYYYVLEDDGQYHEYSRVHSRLGDNWLEEKAKPKYDKFEDAAIITATSQGFRRVTDSQDWSRNVSDIRTSSDGWGEYKGLIYYKRAIGGRGGDNTTIWLRTPLTEKGKKALEEAFKKTTTITKEIENTFLEIINNNQIPVQSENSRRALEAGTAVDKVVRDFFTSKETPVKPENLSESAFIDLISNLTEIKSKMEQMGETFMADNIVLFHKYADGTRVAGEVDILSVDKNGNFKIYDVKTSRYSFEHRYFTEKSSKQRMSTKDYYTLQLSAYQNLFESQYGVKPIKLAILPFVVTYETITNKAELPSGKRSNLGLPIKTNTKGYFNIGKHTSEKDARFEMVSMPNNKVMFAPVMKSAAHKNTMRGTDAYRTAVDFIGGDIRDAIDFILVEPGEADRSTIDVRLNITKKAKVFVVTPSTPYTSQTSNIVSKIEQQKGIPVTYNSAVPVPLASAVQAPQQQNALPIFDPTIETMITEPKEQNRVLPENAFEEGGEIGYYEKDGKLYNGYLKKVGEIEVTYGSGKKDMVPIHLTKVRDRGFGREGEFGSTSEYLTVFPNGMAISTRTNDTNDDHAAKIIMEALSKNPAKVQSLASEKTQISDGFGKKEESPAQLSGAATTVQREDAINNYDEEFEDELELSEREESPINYRGQEFILEDIPSMTGKHRSRVKAYLRIGYSLEQISNMIGDNLVEKAGARGRIWDSLSREQRVAIAREFNPAQTSFDSEYSEKGYSMNTEYQIEDIEPLITSELYSSPLFQRVLAIARQFGITVQFRNRAMSDTAEGLYGYNRIAIQISPNSPYFEQVIMHELIHSVTQGLINREGTGELTPEQESAVKMLREVFESVQSKYGKDSWYGLSNLAEFVAELANPKFREFLKSQRVEEGTSLWNKVKSFFKRLFGNKLELSDATLERMLENPIKDSDKEGLFQKIRERTIFNKDLSQVEKLFIQDFILGLSAVDRLSGRANIYNPNTGYYYTVNFSPSIEGHLDNLKGGFDGFEVMDRRKGLKSSMTANWDRLDSNLQETLKTKGWTQEKFDSISQRERDQAVECLSL